VDTAKDIGKGVSEGAKHFYNGSSRSSGLARKLVENLMINGI